MNNEKEDTGTPVKDPFDDWAENLTGELREEENRTPAANGSAEQSPVESAERKVEDGTKENITNQPDEAPDRDREEQERAAEEQSNEPAEITEVQAKESGEADRPDEPAETPEEQAKESEEADRPNDPAEITKEQAKEPEEADRPNDPAEITEVQAKEPEEADRPDEPAEITEVQAKESGEADRPNESAKQDTDMAEDGTGQPAALPVEDPEKQKRRRILIGGVVGALAVVAVAGTLIHRHYTEYYRTRFFKGTVINGRDVSKKTVDEVKAGIVDTVSKYSLKIRELDRDEKITAGQIGLEYVDDHKIDELMEEQDESKWILHLSGGNSFDINAGTKYDEEKMTATISALECFKEENVVKPQDAALKDENNVFSIQNEVEGNEVNLEKFTKAVTDAVKQGKNTVDIVRDDCYEHPSVYRDDETLKARMDKWNEYMRVNVSYAFGDNIEVVNGDTVKPYVVDDGTTVDLPTDWIRSFVYGWGQKYDTFGLARPFTTHSGEQIMIEEGGDYGWVINKDVMIDDVTDAILTGAQGERPTTFLYSAMGWDNGDLTGTYVEVSIAEQHLWCYKDYELVMDTDVVTGLPTPERETVRGCFAIDAKKEDATLGSLDVQGYASPVSYWAPFNGGQGLHDAPWRGSFGGDIYQSNGSHGCVNIPPSNMEAIYDAIEIGNAVVVY